MKTRPSCQRKATVRWGCDGEVRGVTSKQPAILHVEVRPSNTPSMAEDRNVDINICGIRSDKVVQLCRQLPKFTKKALCVYLREALM
jgi:hypothetical protein